VRRTKDGRYCIYAHASAPLPESVLKSPRPSHITRAEAELVTWDVWMRLSISAFTAAFTVGSRMRSAMLASSKSIAAGLR